MLFLMSGLQALIKLKVQSVRLDSVSLLDPLLKKPLVFRVVRQCGKTYLANERGRTLRFVRFVKEIGLYDFQKNRTNRRVRPQWRQLKEISMTCGCQSQ